MTKRTEHTPTPLQRNGHYVETVAKPHLTIADIYGTREVAVAVADDIVRAVNAHADLVAALEAVEWVYDSEIDGLFCPTCALPKPTHTRGCQLAAALAKAKENTAHEARLQQRDLDEETL